MAKLDPTTAPPTTTILALDNPGTKDLFYAIDRSLLVGNTMRVTSMFIMSNMHYHNKETGSRVVYLPADNTQWTMYESRVGKRSIHRHVDGTELRFQKSDPIRDQYSRYQNVSTQLTKIHGAFEDLDVVLQGNDLGIDFAPYCDMNWTPRQRHLITFARQNTTEIVRGFFGPEVTLKRYSFKYATLYWLDTIHGPRVVVEHFEDINKRREFTVFSPSGEVRHGYANKLTEELIK